jgi:DNA invertase Pin-like site-specific DNA recombinase
MVTWGIQWFGGEVKVAIYARVSAEDQAERNTFDIQFDALRRLADDAVEYVDDGISGKVPLGQRPAGARLLADASEEILRGRGVQVGRLGRSLRGILDAYDALYDLGVTFRSATESIDTSSVFGRAMFQFLAVIVEWEHGTIVERTTAGKRRISREGKWHGGECPYGYAIVGGFLVPRELEATVVAELTFYWLGQEPYIHLGLKDLAGAIPDEGIFNDADGGRHSGPRGIAWRPI